jgi:hypothetical protein
MTLPNDCYTSGDPFVQSSIDNGAQMVGCSIRTVDSLGNASFINMNSVKQVKKVGGDIWVCWSEVPYWSVSWTHNTSNLDGTDFPGDGASWASTVDPPPAPPIVPEVDKPLWQAVCQKVSPGPGFDADALLEDLAILAGCCDCAKARET